MRWPAMQAAQGRRMPAQQPTRCAWCVGDMHAARQLAMQAGMRGAAACRTGGAHLLRRGCGRRLRVCRRSARGSGSGLLSGRTQQQVQAGQLHGVGRPGLAHAGHRQTVGPGTGVISMRLASSTRGVHYHWAAEPFAGVVS